MMMRKKSKDGSHCGPVKADLWVCVSKKDEKEEKNIDQLVKDRRNGMRNPGGGPLSKQ